MVVLTNFHFFPPTPPKHVHLFPISVKNQARLTHIIVGSYSQVFTVDVVKGHLIISSVPILPMLWIKGLENQLVMYDVQSVLISIRVIDMCIQL